MLEAGGTCSPEDVGGSGGYADFLQIMNNQADPEYEETRQWVLSQGYRPHWHWILKR
ncbi:IS1096 element passenger TnpR family protein [Lentibacillus salinarum]|uniref:Plasmid pRiA4b Orf3-like domain-containing protein n=1 Tax=Lentibacillus salinarum TaxID=446820 RepID=A0ABW3ZTU5_9BACI